MKSGCFQDKKFWDSTPGYFAENRLFTSLPPPATKWHGAATRGGRAQGGHTEQSYRRWATVNSITGSSGILP